MPGYGGAGVCGSSVSSTDAGMRTGYNGIELTGAPVPFCDGSNGSPGSANPPLGGSVGTCMIGFGMGWGCCVTGGVGSDGKLTAKLYPPSVAVVVFILASVA